MPSSHRSMRKRLKAKSAGCLRRYLARPNENLSPGQYKAIKSLKERGSIVILKADKGNATVVMDKEEYHKKCLTLLQPPTYVPLLKDPTARVERRVMEVLKQLQKEGAIDKKLLGKL